MAYSTPYSPPTLTGYNSSPPADDGRQTATNAVRWSTHKNKLGDPLRDYAQAISSALVTAFANLPTAINLPDGRVAPTDSEDTFGVTPLFTRFANEVFPGDIRRYGGGPDEDAGTNDNAMVNALAANQTVTLPYISDGVYDVTSPVVLLKWGQELCSGGRNGEPVSQTDEGCVLNVVSGFPTTGGDAAQSVIVGKDRYQKVRGIAIACNSIAAHGLFLTYVSGSIECAFGEYEDLWILQPNGDGVLCTEGTWMNAFRKIRVSFPIGGWCFNFDTTTGAGHTTSVLENCYGQDNVLTGTALGAFRYDKCLSFAMEGCAGDAHINGYPISLEAGSSVACEGWYQEFSRQAFEVQDSESFLTVMGALFNTYGSNSATVADIFNINGGFSLRGARFANGEASTVFADLGSGARVDWFGNGVRLLEQTNTINSSAEINADNIFRPTASTTARFRREIQSSTPSMTFNESDRGTDLKLWEQRVAAGVWALRTLADDYTALGTAISYDRATGQWTITGLQNYADDTAAAAGGVPINGLYRNSSGVQIRVT